MISNPLLGDANDFIKSKEHLVKKVCMRFSNWLVSNRGVLDYGDLYSAGLFGLLKAYESYNPMKGAFDAFAYPQIDGRIRNYIRDYGFQVRYPRSYREKYIKLCKHELDFNTPVEQLSEQSGMSIQDVSQALEYSKSYVPYRIDAVAYGIEDGDSILDRMMSDNNSIDDRLIAEETMQEILRILKPQELVVVKLRMQGKYQREIGKILGVSQMTAGRILKKAYDKIERIAEVRV